MHCLRRYRDTRHAFPHLTNAGGWDDDAMMIMRMIVMMVILMIIISDETYASRKIHNYSGDQHDPFWLCHALRRHSSGNHDFVFASE